MAQNSEPVALDSIKAFFVAPLSPSKQEALQTLFAPDFDHLYDRYVVSFVITTE
jgi:hypothetical protein